MSNENNDAMFQAAWEHAEKNKDLHGIKVLDVSDDATLNNTITLLFDEESKSQVIKCGMPDYMAALKRGDGKWGLITDLHCAFLEIISYEPLPDA